MDDVELRRLAGKGHVRRSSLRLLFLFSWPPQRIAHMYCHPPRDRGESRPVHVSTCDVASNPLNPRVWGQLCEQRRHVRAATTRFQALSCGLQPRQQQLREPRVHDWKLRGSLHTKPRINNARVLRPCVEQLGNGKLA